MPGPIGPLLVRGCRPERSHGRSRSEELLPGSVTKHLSAEDRSDVLVSDAGEA